jgi:Cytochrome bd terminal oxidase subunit II
VVMFWVAILAISILLYVLLDGFDLGVGILFGLTHNETRRHAMLSAVAPIWDGNETWLVVAGVILWGAFPIVYATLFSAFHLPLLLMLAGLILRGVAFEYRYKTERMRWIWDAGFAGGSLVAAFMQGLTVGALVEELPINNGQYTGGEFGWLSPFAVLCGIGLCLGYALLGACWLVKKCDGDVREAAYRLIPYLSVGLLAFPDRGLCKRPGREPSGRAQMARAAVSIRLPGNQCTGGNRTRRECSTSSGRTTLLHDRGYFLGGVRHAGDLVLALHDSVLDHDRGSRRTAFQSSLHVLGRGSLRLSADAALHRDQLHRLQRQG